MQFLPHYREALYYAPPGFVLTTFQRSNGAIIMLDVKHLLVLKESRHDPLRPSVEDLFLPKA